MAQQYSLTRPAASDLEEILVFIGEDSLEAARRACAKLLDHCRKLANAPRLGRERPELGEGVRSWPVGNYVILYRTNRSHTVVLRMLHGARDLNELFG